MGFPKLLFHTGEGVASIHPVKYLRAVTMTDPGVATKVKIIIRIPEGGECSASIADKAKEYLLKQLPGVQVHSEVISVVVGCRWTSGGYHIL